MYYLSTRDSHVQLTAAQAITQGLSVDGGLLTPVQFPKLTSDAFTILSKQTYQERAATIMGLYLEEFSAQELLGFAGRAYGGGKFSHQQTAPLVRLDDKTSCLELWHGPTCAFKDMALQMLPQLLSASLVKTGETRTVCILVATSGDTGKAALEGFRDVERTRVLVFYPKDGVSDIQQLQMVTQEGQNVGVCAVEGNFDDAQTGVKQIFSDSVLRETLTKRGFFLSSANSINWGRVLPQIVYYISAYCDLIQENGMQAGEKVNFCVPTGNFGNILAGYYAKKMGLPIGRLICASNANNVLTDFLNTGIYNRSRPFHTTMSPSMDILISSNLERLLFDLSGEDDGLIREYMSELFNAGKYTVSEDIKAGLDAHFAAGYCDDVGTAAQIGKMWSENHYLIDPHTAVAFHVLEQYRTLTGDNTPTVVVSTASPFKFCNSVLPAIGVQVAQTGVEMIEQLAQVTDMEPPQPLAELKGKQVRFHACAARERMVEQVLEMLV